MGTIRSKYPTPQALARAYQETIQAALVRGGDGVSVAQGLLTGLPGVGPVRSRAVYDHLFSYGANFML